MLRPRLLAALVAAHVLSSALHFADSALRFDHYHDEAKLLLNPVIVVIAWFLQTGLGLTGLALQRRGRAAGRPLLVAYGALGLAGLLHYLAPPAGGLHAEMQVLIGLEAATGLALGLILVLTWKDEPRPSSRTADT